MKLKQHELYHCLLTSFPFLIVPDTTLVPTIQCSQQPISQTSTGVNTLVTFARPTVQDNCVTVSVACTGRSPTNSVITISTSGSNNQQGSFPVGTSTVTCTATDGASQTASCNFSVIGMLNEGLKFEQILSRNFEI